MKRFFSTPGLLTATALLLAGCAVPGFSDEEDTDALQCPTLTILDDAGTLSRFATPTSQDLTDLAFEARMANQEGSCAFDVDGAAGPGTVDVDLNFAFDIATGPAGPKDAVTFAYFVGVTDKTGQVLNKARFSVRAALPGQSARVQVADEPVHLRIPLKAGETGNDYHLVAGFQLNQSELEYNRRKQRTGR